MDPVNPHVRTLTAYQPGLQPREGQRVVKLNTNENPYPPSPRVLEAIREAATDRLRLYPDPTSRELREVAAQLYDVDPRQVLAGNGSDEILGILIRTFAARGEAVGYYDPSYSYYGTLASIHALNLVPVAIESDAGPLPLPPRRDLKLFFLTNPNSPLGFSVGPDFVARLARHLEGVLVVDEAYADFASTNCMSLLRSVPNLVVTRSLSKSYGLAGLRIGLAVGPRDWIEQMDKVRDHYNLNRVAQAAAVAALKDRAYFRQTVERVLKTRRRLLQGLRDLGLRCPEPEGNFVFARFPSAEAAAFTYRRLFERGILVRTFAHRTLEDGIRISLGTYRDTDLLLQEIRAALAQTH